MSRFAPLTGGMPRLLGIHQGHLAARYRALYRGFTAKHGTPEANSPDAMLMGMCAQAAAEMEAAGQEVGRARRELGKLIKAHLEATERYTANLAALRDAFPEPGPPKSKAEVQAEKDQREFDEGMARGWRQPSTPGSERPTSATVAATSPPSGAKAARDGQGQQEGP